MRHQNSIESVIKTMNVIHRDFTTHWENYLNYIEKKLSDTRWREARLGMFGASVHGQMNLQKYRYLAAAECAIECFRIPSGRFSGQGRAWGAIPSADWACLMLSWRDSPVVLDFDAELMQCLQESDIDNTVHVSESLNRLPYDCFFVASDFLEFGLLDREGKLKSVTGYFVEREWLPLIEQPQRVEEHLIITLVGKNSRLAPIVLPLHFSRFKDIVNDVTQTIFKASREEDLPKKTIEKDLCAILNPLLYIASGEPDISLDANSGIDVNEDKEKEIVYDVEKEKDIPIARFIVGGNFRAKYDRIPVGGKGAKTGHRMAPHIRRGHFHTYIVGSRKDNKTKRVLKWVEPTPINMKKDDSPIILRRVD